MIGSNRILLGIEKFKVRIKNIPQEKIDVTSKSLDLSFEEFVRFQEIKSLAFASGKLTLPESMTIFNYLGDLGPERFNKQPIEVKAVLTQVFSELLTKAAS